jgi:hypothetical protein
MQIGRNRHALGGPVTATPRAGHPHILAVVVERAEVDVFPGVGVLGGGGVEVFFVDVAERDDVLAADFGGVGFAAPAGADDGDVKLLVGGDVARAGLREGGDGDRGCGHGQGRAIEEMTARERAADRGSFTHGLFLRLSFRPDKHIFGS